MTGLIHFSIDRQNADNFKRSFKKLEKIHKDGFVELIEKILERLIDNPYPNSSRNEPLPGKIRLPEGWTFHKLETRISKGASGQIRLMYLVNESTHTIKLAWIYSHDQFEKRPSDAALKSVFKEILGF